MVTSDGFVGDLYDRVIAGHSLDCGLQDRFTSAPKNEIGFSVSMLLSCECVVWSRPTTSPMARQVHRRFRSMAI